MTRAILALALLLLLASCGGRVSQAPRNLDNACAIIDQRPSYLRAFKATEREWGVPVAVLMAVIYQESKFISDNRPPHKYVLGVIPSGRQSSAYGYAQALDGTWDEYRKKRGRRGAKRNRIRDAADFMGWYMAGSSRSLGIALSDTYRQYLAYHEGRTGFKRGSYSKKPWLTRIAGEVAQRAVTYDIQLRRCGKI